ncbi:MAG: hypothetical protein ABEJ82_05965 [Haloplanus sp.]
MSFEPSDELSAMGRAIREDLAGSLDAGLLETGLAGLEEQMTRLPAVRNAGIPDADSTRYQEIAAPAWRINDHLVDVDFFASAETNLPAFTTDHVESATRELVQATPLTERLSTVGFTEREKVALVAHVAASKKRLGSWAPTKKLPEEVVEFDPEHVAPLHHRAAEGALLWVDDLDFHLWQREYLVTDEILDHGMRDLKRMIGGFYLLASAACDVAGRSELSDGQLTAALTAGTASLILGQEDLADDVYRITDDMRAPREV